MAAKEEDPRIAPLLRERDVLVRVGKKDRAEQVEAELRQRGYRGKFPDVAGDPGKGPHGRQAAPQQQATQEPPENTAQTSAADDQPVLENPDAAGDAGSASSDDADGDDAAKTAPKPGPKPSGRSSGNRS